MENILSKILARPTRCSTPLLAVSAGALILLATSPAKAAYSPDTWFPGAGWVLNWSDEFNGTSIDLSKWNYDLGGGGWGNRELETYTSNSANSRIQNTTIINGTNISELVITAIKNRNKYTSARMKTQGKHSWKFGKFAARIRLPYGQGIWPAFWTLGTNITTVGWPKCGEIDILEMIGGGEDRDDSYYGTLHWGNLSGNHVSVGSGRKELPDPQFLYQDYHVFEIEWSSTEVIWRIDGTEYFQTSITQSDQTEFQEEFFIILNLAVGGSWPGNPTGATVFPQSMYVDWVRVYQKPTLP